MLQRHPSKACLIRHRALSRHNTACRRGPRHPPRASKAPLVWLKLGRAEPPCPAPVTMGVSSSQTLLSRRTPIPTGRVRHLFACGNFLNMCLLVRCPMQCACAQNAVVRILCKLSSCKDVMQSLLMIIHLCYRSLGDALQQWRSRLAVTGDSATPQQDTSEDAGIDNAPDAPPDQPPDASQGEYEYMAEGEGRAEGETQALAPATEDQAKSIEALDQSGMPDQDADDVTAAEPEAEPPTAESAERLSAEQVLRSDAAGGQAPASIQQEKKKSEEQSDHKLSGAEGEAAADDVMGEAEEDRMRLDDSYVSAQMQRASLSDGTGDGLPDEDMVLAEGGLNAESAQQLRREVELRVKAASDGTLVLDTSQRSIAYGQEVCIYHHVQCSKCCYLSHLAPVMVMSRAPALICTS